MSVAFYAPLKSPHHPVPSGDRMLGRMLVAALNRSGREVAVVSSLRSLDKTGDATRQARLRAIGLRQADRMIRHLLGRPEEEWPTLWFTYHLYYKAPDWLGPRVSKALGIPYVVAEASHAPKQAGGPWDLGHRAVEDALGQADRVICLNPVDAACVRPLLASPDRLTSLKPFLDITEYRDVDPVAVRAAIAEAYGLDPGRPWLLAAAMMREGDKLASYRLLGRALRHVPGRNFQVIVAGDGPARPAVEEALAAIRPLYLGELGPNRMIPLYAACDLLVWPAINEAFGMVLLEAQAAGLPVVAGRTGGVASIVEDEKSGLLVPLRDADAFAEAVAFLLLNPGLRHRMGHQAAWRVQRDHSMEAATYTLTTILDALAPPRGRPDGRPPPGISFS